MGFTIVHFYDTLTYNSGCFIRLLIYIQVLKKVATYLPYHIEKSQYHPTLDYKLTVSVY